MRKIFEMKRTILTCLMIGMLVGGMGERSYAAEVVGTQFGEEMNQPLLGRVRHVSCTVDKNGVVTYEVVLGSGLPMPDDGMLYLFEMAPYEYNISSETKIIEAMPFDSSETTIQFTFPVNFRQEDTRLYSKFAVPRRLRGIHCRDLQERRNRHRAKSSIIFLWMGHMDRSLDGCLRHCRCSIPENARR